MAMKLYLAFWSPIIILFRVSADWANRTFVGWGLSPLQRNIQCIPLPLPTEPQDTRYGVYCPLQRSSCWFYCSSRLGHQCCILTFDPAKHAIPKWCTRRKWHIPMAVMRRNRVGRLGWQGKIPWYTHRLMHQKRVTCELHDSYFRLMTIKHAIPKLEWAIELLYNSVKTGSQLLRDQMS